MKSQRREQIRRALLRQLAPRGALSEEKKQPGRVSEEKKRIEDTLEQVLSPIPTRTPPPFGGHELRERRGGEISIGAAAAPGATVVSNLPVFTFIPRRSFTNLLLLSRGNLLRRQLIHFICK
jgi:hypothetical protein